MDISNITAVGVSYKHKHLTIASINSIKKHHPDMKFIIIDGSEENSECRLFVQNELSKDPNIKCLLSNVNIGHGRGMNTLLNRVTTKYAIVFDSDMEMTETPLEEMLKVIGDNYGVGEIQYVNKEGINIPQYPISIPYLHPYFCMINVEQYKKFKPFFHHGAPCLSAMWDLFIQKKSNLLIDFPVKKYIKHDFGGTSDLERKIGNTRFGVGDWGKI